MTTELTPEFAITVRGYDRAQVDDYVDTLREWLNNAAARMQTAESESAGLRDQITKLQERIAELDKQSTGTPPRTISVLGDRVTQILKIAEEGAEEARKQAEAESAALVSKARQEADQLLGSVKAKQAELDAALASVTERAQQKIEEAESAAKEKAARLIAEAESRATGREAQAEQRAREIVERADSQRARVLEELATQRTTQEAQLQTLVKQRDEMLTGLTQLRESLQRSIGSLPGVGSGPQPTIPSPPTTPETNSLNH